MSGDALRLGTELHRILEKRITKALHKIKYDPARHDEATLAREVLRPFAPVEPFFIVNERETNGKP